MKVWTDAVISVLYVHLMPHELINWRLLAFPFQRAFTWAGMASANKEELHNGVTSKSLMHIPFRHVPYDVRRKMAVRLQPSVGHCWRSVFSCLGFDEVELQVWWEGLQGVALWILRFLNLFIVCILTLNAGCGSTKPNSIRLFVCSQTLPKLWQYAWEFCRPNAGSSGWTWPTWCGTNPPRWPPW